MTLRIDSKKWILYRHTTDFGKLVVLAEILKSYTKTGISKEDKTNLNLKLRELGLYNERNPELPLDAINHKINQLSYYMFGYQTKIDGQDRFLFSPLGNLFLKHLDNKEKTAKIFLGMLWAVQYEHPHSRTDSEFQLYPFRLIYKLLTEPKLSNKLYAFEVAYLVVFIREVTKAKYEELVNDLKAEACSSLVVEEVSGDDIVKYYLEKNYSCKYGREGGSLFSSCMRNSSNSPAIKFYAKCPNVKMIIVKDGTFILGRAMLFNTNVGWFVDRRYYATDFINNHIVQYAISKKYHYKAQNNYSTNFSVNAYNHLENKYHLVENFLMYINISLWY